MRQANSDQFRAKTIALLLFMGLIFADAVVAFYLLRGKILFNLNTMARQNQAVYLPIVLSLPEQPAQAVSPTEPVPTLTPAPPQKVYVVQPGDTLFGIAQENGVSLEDLARANNIADVDLILVGQELVIPDGSSQGSSSSTTPPKDTEIP